VESLYQVKFEQDSAWEGTLIKIAGRTSIGVENKSITELDSILPEGETGKLIWRKDEDFRTKRKI
jgi:hypothetical protein